VEAEYIALSTAMRDLLPGRALLKEIGAKWCSATNSLVDFINQVGSYFMVVPYNLTEYQHVDNLPLAIDNIEKLPEEADKWLAYFPQAKPRFQGSNMYMAVLIGMSIPFPKFIK